MAIGAMAHDSGGKAPKFVGLDSELLDALVSVGRVV